MPENQPLEAIPLPETSEDEAPRRGPPPGLALDPPAPVPTHEPEIPVDRLDPDALKVIYRLRHVGHQAYFVGGCVRDLLLAAKPKDFDIATDAHPGEVRAVFRNCRLIGRRFRLAHVYFRGGKVIEVATFRKNPVEVAEDVPEDGDLLITRDNVFGTAEEDAVRRDFTVNGLFYDVASGEVIDYVGGRADLDARRIATIGDPEIRMREDPVRALRAVRFAARLGFTISPDTFEAMRRHAGELARCAPPRVLEEIFKILRCGGSARAFELLRSSGALPVVLPALAAALDAWDEAGRRAFFAHLSGLDRLVRRGEAPSDAVLLGALLMNRLSGGAQLHAPPAPPLAPGQPRPAAPPLADGERWDDADALLAGLVQTARLPRKVAERTRLALHAQRLFHDPPRKRRRRGRGLAGQQYFEDALHLLRVSVEATGEGADVLARWETSAGAPHEGEGEPRHERPEREGERRGPHGRGRRHGREPGRRDAGDEGDVAAAGPSHEPEVPATEVAATVDDDRGSDGAPPAVEVDATAGAQAEAGAAGHRRRRRRGGRRRRRRGGTAPAEGGGGSNPAAGSTT